MNRLRHTYYILLAMLLGAASCKEETDLPTHLEDTDPIVLQGIHAIIDNGGDNTRAVAPLVDQIGKYSFYSTDEIIFTKIQRTKHPIEGFSYKDVRYSCGIESGNVSWKREDPTNDIFWSDGSEPHTFIGYILPHLDTSSATASGYDWKYDEDHQTYYGSIGDPADATEMIDYTCTPGAADQRDPYSHEKLRKEDLLLAHDTDMQNEDAFANIYFHHGLASVRVVVTITGFSATGVDPDAETKVTDMVLHNQPTMYKWDGQSYQTAPLTQGDQTLLDGFWSGLQTVPQWNQKKEMKLWQPREYQGSKASRTFTFYGITVPGGQDEVNLTFQVSYPDPLSPNPQNRMEKTYTAQLKLDGRQVEFRPGYCTNISVNLNHKDEKMTVGAEYMSWQNDDNPDEGSLRKNTTFLSYTDRSKVTILGDDKATADDATWLYTGTSGKIYDIYGNDGSPDKPFLICTADQLLSFAHEVMGTSRKAITYHNIISDSDVTLAAGSSFNFTGYYIKLDADITMQPTNESTTSVTWMGIGDATHVFNGVFLGSGRYINYLYGSPFFNKVGDYAVIDKVNFAHVINVTGSGVVANENNGLICGCNVEGGVTQANPGAAVSYCGSFVGDNKSFIVACTHVGNVTGYGYVGGLVGHNAGAIVASYHSGLVAYGTGATDSQKLGIGGSTGLKDETKSIIFSCYQNRDSITHEPNLLYCRAAWPLTTTQMQSNAFVNSDSEPLGGWTLEPSVTNEGDTYSPYITDADKHYSLNKALQKFSEWVEKQADKGTDIVLPCHSFSAAQVQTLHNLFSKDENGQLSPNHLYKYVPGSYPKVQ